VDPGEQDALALENLAYAARAADRVGAVLLVEPLNRVESPRYPLLSAESAATVVERVNSLTGLGNARLLMDLYHLGVNGADVPAAIDRYAGITGHVQIADAPGRGAPGTGALPLGAWLDRLVGAGYDGLVGLEYRGGDGDFGWLR